MVEQLGIKGCSLGIWRYREKSSGKLRLKQGCNAEVNDNKIKLLYEDEDSRNLKVSVQKPND